MTILRISDHTYSQFQERMHHSPEYPRTLPLQDRIFNSDSDCLLMGILNITPDSFSDGGSFTEVHAAVAHGLKMVEEGADIIDIGGESSRPGAAEISVSDEMQRVLPVIKELRSKSVIPISIDTRHAAVAAAAIEAGADMINDISALQHDHAMMETAAKTQAPVVLMHMQGTPATMQDHPTYENVVEEVMLFFKERIADCRQHGVTRIVLDPGIGFGKTIEHNLALLRDLTQFRQLGFPLLVGASRKSFIGSVTGAAVGDRLPGSLASSLIAYQQGASILRVHDVRATRDAIATAAAIMNGEMQHAV